MILYQIIRVKIWGIEQLLSKKFCQRIRSNEIQLFGEKYAKVYLNFFFKNEI